MNQILEGWKKILIDYRHWKMIIKYPYCYIDNIFFFGDLGHPLNSLDDYFKELKKLDPDWEKNYYDNLWDLYDEVEPK